MFKTIFHMQMDESRVGIIFVVTDSICILVHGSLTESGAAIQYLYNS
jgi:hypothetical protein